MIVVYDTRLTVDYRRWITRDNHFYIPPFYTPWILFNVSLTFLFFFFFFTVFISIEILESVFRFTILNAIVLTTCLRDVKKRCKRIAFGHETVHDFTWHSFISVFCMHSHHYITLKSNVLYSLSRQKIISDNFANLAR